MPVSHTVNRILSLLCSLLLAGCMGSGSDGTQVTQNNAALLSNNVTAIAAGFRHGCALTAGGGVQCWGDNSSGQLGDVNNTAAFPYLPADVAGLTSGITAISTGLNFTCALTVAGGVQCLGGNQRGQLGDGTNINSEAPVDVAGLTSGISAISAGMNFVCALTTGGGVKCLGDNRVGELGNSTTSDAYAAVDVTGLSSGVASISAGENVACARTTVGSVLCWGDNSYDELGSGATTIFNIPVDVSGLTSGMSAVSPGVDFICALTTGGGVQCLGNNAAGQLGDGTTDLSPTPVDVIGLTSGVASVASGSSHTCALTVAGGVKCWGDNSYGELGNGSTTSSSLPVNVTGLTSGVVAVTSGVGFACALTSAGAVQCWGDNAAGQLGNGKTSNALEPVTVTGLSSGVAAIRAGHNSTCALTATGSVKCWGEGAYGALGNGAAITSTLPVDVTGLSSGVTAIAVGYQHACALTTGGVVQCWGNNAQGQLGNGSNVTSAIPVPVTGLSSGVIAVSVGNLNSCALTSGGGVKCWGNGSYGELGNGSTVSSSVPVDVTGLTSGVAAIAASLAQNSACALTTGGSVKCWGDTGTYTPGIGTLTQSSVPLIVTGLESGVASLSVGAHHACVLTVAGGVKCWGNGSHGELGDGTTGPYYTVPDGAAAAYSAIPMDVTGLTSGVATVSAGRDFTCALTTAGGVQCWGNNGVGQLGNGTTVTSAQPVAVTGLSSGVAAIATGGAFACALTTAGKVKCWGNNLFGELGNNTDAAKLSSSVPVDVLANP
jgi:alpha-tubulin suppressor-like RCC1 family protein